MAACWNTVERCNTSWGGVWSHHARACTVQLCCHKYTWVCQPIGEVVYILPILSAKCRDTKCTYDTAKITSLETVLAEYAPFTEGVSNPQNANYELSEEVSLTEKRVGDPRRTEYAPFDFNNDSSHRCHCLSEILYICQCPPHVA